MLPHIKIRGAWLIANGTVQIPPNIEMGSRRLEDLPNDAVGISGVKARNGHTQTTNRCRIDRLDQKYLTCSPEFMPLVS
jgi:hypothetical protein